MKIKFWGVRGSIPSPGPHTVIYGGNTTCIEVRTNDNELIILDGGTGIFPLAQELLAEIPITAHIFITHTHWDHIHGLPFFSPLFIPGNRINLHGGFDIVTRQGIEHALSIQLQYSYFPIREAEIKANLEYFTLTENQTTQIGTTLVTPTTLNHPVLNFGYKIQQDDKSLFFTGDHEPPYNIYDPDDEDFDDYQTMVMEKEQHILQAVKGVDILIADCSYTLDEYPAKQGWGHGTFDSSIQLAKKAGVKKLICTHHEPIRSDEHLENVFQKVLDRHSQTADEIEIILAREGLELEL